MDWFRMYTEAKNDAKLRSLTDSQHRVWFNLLCFAAEQKENRGSLVIHDMELLAVEVANGDAELLSETIQRLQKLRIISVEDDTITFLNFSKRQYDKPSDKPEATRERKRRQREKESHADVTPSHATDTDTDPNTEKDKKTCASEPVEQPDNAPAEKPQSGGAQRKAGKGEDFTAEFECFWVAYPRRIEKKAAFKAWNARLKEEYTPEALITASQNYSISCRENRTEERYIKHPKTFLGPSKPFEDYTKGPVIDSKQPRARLPDEPDEKKKRIQELYMS